MIIILNIVGLLCVPAGIHNEPTIFSIIMGIDSETDHLRNSPNYTCMAR